MKVHLPLVAGMLMVGLLGPCLGGCEESRDPRVAAIEQEKPAQKTVDRSRDPKFESFREICRAERKAIMALVAYRRSIGGKPKTAEEVARYSELQGAVKPFSDQLSDWANQSNLTDEDREAMRYIHDVEVNGPEAGN